MRMRGKWNVLGSWSSRRLWLLLLLATVSLGCARTDLMDYRPKEGFDVEAPRPGKALVIFLRPGAGGRLIENMISSTVFDDQDPVAILMGDTYAAYQTTPGKHRFMVLGEAADFMDADLDAGKVYCAMIVRRFGVWRTRFSLKPVTPHDPEWQSVREWIDDARLVTLNAAGRSWAQANAQSIREKHDAYLKEWLAKDERPALYHDDGVAFADLP